MSLKRRHSPRTSDRDRPLPVCGVFESVCEEIMETIALFLPTAASLQALACTCRRWARILGDPKVQATLKTRFATNIVPVTLSGDTLAHVTALPNWHLHGTAEAMASNGVIVCSTWDTNLLSGKSIEFQRRPYSSRVDIVHCDWLKGKKHGFVRVYKFGSNALLEEREWKNGRRHGTHRTYLYCNSTEVDEDDYKCGRWLGSRLIVDGITRETRVPRGRFSDVKVFYSNQQLRASYTRLTKQRRNTSDWRLLFGDYRSFHRDGTPEWIATFSDDGKLLRAELFSQQKGYRTVYDREKCTIVCYSRPPVCVKNACVSYKRHDWALMIEVLDGKIGSDRRVPRNLLYSYAIDDSDDSDQSYANH